MSASEELGERSFIALTLPSAVRAALAGLVAPLPGVGWTEPQHLHVTLRFLGKVATETMARVNERLAAIRVEPFILPIEGVGCFPPDAPPRIVWVGVGNGHPRLYQLRQRLDDSLLAAGLDLELRAFHPHVTVARCQGTPLAAIKLWLREKADFAAAPFRVETFELYASRLIPSGPDYALLRRFPLFGNRNLK